MTAFAASSPGCGRVFVRPMLAETYRTKLPPFLEDMTRLSDYSTGKACGPRPANTLNGNFAYPSQMLVQNSFADVQRQLEETVSKLKTVRDPDRRRTLLREMRRLLAEAQRISSQPQNQ